jgi:hypothetical protein
MLNVSMFHQQHFHQIQIDSAHVQTYQKTKVV